MRRAIRCALDCAGHAGPLVSRSAISCIEPAQHMPGARPSQRLATRSAIAELDSSGLDGRAIRGLVSRSRHERRREV